ncbi:MAG: hypothetical protein LBT46_09700 [Planctomycetaceae bacterium]|jgi:hypothetical protein|nr:hypothetical protein [Planctomycetaceae bacterium]
MRFCRKTFIRRNSQSAHRQWSIPNPTAANYYWDAYFLPTPALNGYTSDFYVDGKENGRYFVSDVGVNGSLFLENGGKSVLSFDQFSSYLSTMDLKFGNFATTGSDDIYTLT